MDILKVEQYLPLRSDLGGILRVGNSRVSLDSIVYAYMDGATADQIAEDFPAVDLADIHTLIGFYLRHKAEVADYLRDQQLQADEVRRAIDSIVAKGNLRERLLARQAAKESAHVAAGE